MSYTPVPTDGAAPLDTEKGKTAAAEFRALKSYIQATVLASIAAKLPLAGGTVTGNLLVNGYVRSGDANTYTGMTASTRNFNDNTRTANNRFIEFLWNAGVFYLRFVNDAYSAATNVISVTGGHAAGISNITLGGPTTISGAANVTGALGVTGAVTAASFSGSGAGLTGLPTAPVSSVFGRTGAVTLLSGDVTTALGYTPYNSSNPTGYISGITSGMVTTALGYTPYNSTNPSGYLTAITSGMIAAALGFTPYSNANPAGYLASINSGLVTAALGYTPYNSSNPAGYIANAAGINAALGYTAANAASLGTNGSGARTVSTSAPSGGSDGDTWWQY